MKGGWGRVQREQVINVCINAVMIKILIRTGTERERAEAAGRSNFNKGFLSSILQASSSLSVPFPHSVHITAFCHPSHLALQTSAGHFYSASLVPPFGICH